jgi:hypothetical protein
MEWVVRMMAVPARLAERTACKWQQIMTMHGSVLLCDKALFAVIDTSS